MARFRFIHAADIHLDSPLVGLARAGGAAERIRTATRLALEGLVDRAIEDKAAFLIIAGDLYDGDWRDYQTGLFFVRQMGRLNAAGIPVFLLYGNHDAASQITRRLVLPDNVTTFATRAAESFELPELGVVLHGQGFAVRDVSDNLVPGYPPPQAGRFNIGVLHTGLGGRDGHANYAPCGLPELVAKGYDYWALGHVHQAVILNEHPHVVYCGNLQGRHARETGAKGAMLVTVEDGEVAACAPMPLDVVRWTVLDVAVGESRSEADVFERIRDAVERAVAEVADGRLLACRIVLGGRTPLHGTLVAAADRLLAEARAAALGLGEDAAWIERIVVASEPALAGAALAARKDAIGDLHRSLGAASEDPDLVRQLTDEAAALVRKLPREIRERSEDPLLRAAIEGETAAVIAAAGENLAARLAAESD